MHITQKLYDEILQALRSYVTGKLQMNVTIE
jgi:hypothetical protein